MHIRSATTQPTERDVGLRLRLRTSYPPFNSSRMSFSYHSQAKTLLDYMAGSIISSQVHSMGTCISMLERTKGGGTQVA